MSVFSFLDLLFVIVPQKHVVYNIIEQIGVLQKDKSFETGFCTSRWQLSHFNKGVPKSNIPTFCSENVFPLQLCGHRDSLFSPRMTAA